MKGSAALIMVEIMYLINRYTTEHGEVSIAVKYCPHKKMCH